MSVGSEASTSTRVGEANEVGESSGGQVVEPRWVNDKSHDHMRGRRQLLMETIEQQIKLNKETFETFKEERKKETKDKLAEALAQLKEKPLTPHSA
ncbi:hypothetical protein Tco_1083175 [Tanacetum coccineum]|uniref:Uncharacterized protein n=1 Tax=Tanacetum coccineum TaxID=301880 RepID=A0ABQ5I2L5_9ASTR